MKRRDVLLFFALIIIVSLSQFILARKHLDFGFFTDDWLFLSSYRTFVENPILDILKAWKNIGSHNFAHSYYIGILHNFFGLNYPSYHLLNQILKIISTLSLYPLIYIMTKNRMLAFLATLFFSIHFSPFGTLDNASRGEDFIAITSMNLFLFVYFYILKNGHSNVFLMLGLALWLVFTIFIDPTRLFPLILVVPFVELFKLIQDKTKKQIRVSLKRLLILYSPFIPFFLISPHSITVQLQYSSQIFEKLRDGNWQLFLTPFAALGSTYIPKQSWFLLGNPAYENLSSYMTFLLPGPIFMSYLFIILIAVFVSKKILKFTVRNLGLNLLIGLVVFPVVHNWLFLDPKIRAPVDPGTYLVPSLIGLFIIATGYLFFLEWKESGKKSNLFPILFLGPIFSLSFILLTWIFADINSIFMGVHAYLNIPAIGTSIALATLVVLIYERLRSIKAFGRVISIAIVILILGFYFQISSQSVDQYFSYWLNNGLRASDQQRIIGQFWNELSLSKRYSQDNLPLIYLDGSEDYINGTFYAEVMIWKISSWFDLRFNRPKEDRFNLCDITILSKEELEKFVTIENEDKIVSNKCGKTMVYKQDNFYAFKLINRNLIPNRTEVLEELRIKH